MNFIARNAFVRVEISVGIEWREELLQLLRADSCVRFLTRDSRDLASYLLENREK